MSRVQSPSPTPIFIHFMLHASSPAFERSTESSCKVACDRFHSHTYLEARQHRPSALLGLLHEPLHGAFFDSTHGARIGNDRSQIIEFGKDGSNSAGKRVLFHFHTVVGWQHQDPKARHNSHELLSQLYASDVWQ